VVVAEAVARSPADGHTLLLIASSNTINETLYNRLRFDFIRDIASARLAALGRAHSLLINGAWAGAVVQTIVAAAVSPFRNGEDWPSPLTLVCGVRTQSRAQAL
jgi:hypothetical protein